jgi:hypothetical protein
MMPGIPMTPPRTSRRATRETPEPPAVTAAALAEWFAEAIPPGWFADGPTVRHDADEILVTGDLGPPGAGLTHDQQIAAFREATREQRMQIADEAQQRFRRTVSWGASCGDVDARFTSLNAPAMTRLRLEERAVLDTLIDAGVARSRSEALAWCVRLVGRHEARWIADLRAATETVRTVRDDGPEADRAGSD